MASGLESFFSGKSLDECMEETGGNPTAFIRVKQPYAFLSVFDKYVHTSFLPALAKEDGVNLKITPQGESNLAEMKAEIGKKPLRALSRLKSKGLWADDVSGLRRLISARFPEGYLIPHIYMELVCGIWPTAEESWNMPLSDDMWASVIEYTINLLHPETRLASNDNMQWGLWVEGDIEIIYSILYIAAFANFNYASAAEFYDRLDEASTVQDFAKAVRNEYKSRGKQIERLKQQLEEQETGFKQQISEKDKQILALEREIRDLKSELVSKSKGREKLADILLAAVHNLDDAEKDVETFEADVDITAKYEHELPTSKVLFVGGHPNMTKKLRLKYPDWKFAAASESYSFLNDNMAVEFVFCWSNHLSHKLYDKVKSELADVPLAYVTAVNMDRLDAEMKKAYNEYLAGLESDDSPS